MVLVFICLVVISSDTISEHIDVMKTVGRLRLKLWKESTEKEKQDHKLREALALCRRGLEKWPSPLLS